MSFTHYLQSQNKSKATISIYEKNVLNFVVWCDKNRLEANSARHQDILLFIKDLQKKGQQQSTVRIQVNALQHYFKWLISIGQMTDLPTKGIEVRGIVRKKLYTVLDYKELESLYVKFTDNQAYLSGKYQPWDKQQYFKTQSHRIGYGLMIWQGLSIAELKNLEVKDIQLREGKVYIAGGRRSNERTLDLAPPQIMDLIHYITKTREELAKIHLEENTALFLSARGGEWSKNFMSSLFRDLKVMDARIVNPHHIFASVIAHWLKRHNLRQVQYMAGHRYVSSTEAYLSNNLDDLKEDISKFHPIG